MVRPQKWIMPVMSTSVSSTHDNTCSTGDRLVARSETARALRGRFVVLCSIGVVVISCIWNSGLEAPSAPVQPATLTVPLHESAQTALVVYVWLSLHESALVNTSRLAGMPHALASVVGKPMETPDHHSNIAQNNKPSSESPGCCSTLQVALQGLDSIQNKSAQKSAWKSAQNYHFLQIYVSNIEIVSAQCNWRAF